MLKEAPGPINFTVFLTMFGEKLKGEVREGRGCLDKMLPLFEFFINSQLPLFIFRCWRRGDHPQRLQSLRSWGERNVKERLVSNSVVLCCWMTCSLLIIAACLYSVTEMLTTQADRFSPEEVRAPPQTVLEYDMTKIFFTTNIYPFCFLLHAHRWNRCLRHSHQM